MRSPARGPDMHICYLVHRPTKCLVKRVSDCILLLVCGINITKCIAKHISISTLVTKCIAKHISICTCLFLCRVMCDLVHKRIYMVVYVAYMSVRWFRIALISGASQGVVDGMRRSGSGWYIIRYAALLLLLSLLLLLVLLWYLCCFNEQFLFGCNSSMPQCHLLCTMPGLRHIH